MHGSPVLSGMGKPKQTPMSYKRFVVVADNHGRMVCHETQKKLMGFVNDWNPHYRIHLGDVWDFTPIRKGASNEEKAEGISQDYHQGMEFLDAYKPHLLTLGNHDDRIWMHSTNVDGMLRERCAELAAETEEEFKKRKIKWVPYHISKYLQMPEGGPKLIHGFRSNMYPAKAHADHFGPCIHGHVHKPDTYYLRHIEGGVAHSIGCIGDISQMTYADKHAAKLGWRQGWMYGIINTKTGAWEAWHVTRDTNGAYLSPQGVL